MKRVTVFVFLLFASLPGKKLTRGLHKNLPGLGVITYVSTSFCSVFGSANERTGQFLCPGVKHSTTPHVRSLCCEYYVHFALLSRCRIRFGAALFCDVGVTITPFTYCVNRFFKKRFKFFSAPI